MKCSTSLRPGAPCASSKGLPSAVQDQAGPPWLLRLPLRMDDTTFPHYPNLGDSALKTNRQKEN